MIDYVYRGFKIQYNIDAFKQEMGLYKANGFVAGPDDKKQTTATAVKKFHTESPSMADAESQIKKLIEEYIDFEWSAFKKMQE